VPVHRSLHATLQFCVRSHVSSDQEAVHLIRVPPRATSPSAADGGHWEISDRTFMDAEHLASWLESHAFITSVMHEGALKTSVTVVGIPTDMGSDILLESLDPFGTVLSSDNALLHGVCMSRRVLCMRSRKPIQRLLKIRGAT